MRDTRLKPHTDDELIALGRALIENMCHGDRWRMSIPVHRDDSDVLLSELLDRFGALSTENAEILRHVRVVDEIASLGDQVYAVWERHVNEDVDGAPFTGYSWEHPKVVAYGAAAAALKKLVQPTSNALEQTLDTEHATLGGQPQ